MENLREEPTQEPAGAPESEAAAESPQDADAPAEELAKTSLVGLILVPAALVLAVVGIGALGIVLTYQKFSVQDYSIKLRSPDRTERWRAALELVESNQSSPDLAPILIEILNSPPETQTLEQVGWATSDMLKKPEERNVSLRWYAAAALAKIGSEQALSALLAVVADPDDGVRFYVAHGLGRIRDPKAVAPLMAMLKGDKDPEVRMTAAWALGEIADPQAKDALAAAYEADASKDVKWNCAIAMARFCDARGRATLESMLAESSPHTRDQARRAIKLLDDCARKK